MTFQQKYEKIVAKNNSLLCVGLDPDLNKIPESLKSNSSTPIFDFNKAIIDATHKYVSAYKPNTAFYEATAENGIAQLKQTCDYIRANHSDIPIIIDAKRGDIGTTNKGYVEFIFDYLQADAVTLHPYLGKEALLPFLDRTEKGSILLCRTSNPGAGEFQDLLCHSREDGNPAPSNTQPLYKIIAQKIVNDWNNNNNCMLVVGATYPEELKEVRKIAPNMILLVPGIGAQGGDIEKTLQAGLDSNKSGLIISSSRGIIYASSGEDFAEKAKQEAQKLRDEINKYRL